MLCFSPALFDSYSDEKFVVGEDNLLKIHEV